MGSSLPLRQAGLVLALLALWQYGAVHHPSPQLPRLEAVATAYGRLLAGDLFVLTVVPSLTRMMIGFAAGVLIGIVVGTAIGSHRAIDPWVRPLLELLRFVPAVAILPAALILFGPTDFMRIFVIAFGTTFPILLSADDGARRVDPRRHRNTDAIEPALLPILACLGAALSYGFASVFGRCFKRLGIDPVVGAFGQTAATSAMTLPLVLAFAPPWRTIVPDAPTWAALAGLALLSTALAYVLFFRLLATVGAINTSLVTLLIPVSAILLGGVFLGEHLTGPQVGGMLLIGAGLLAIDGRVLPRR